MPLQFPNPSTPFGERVARRLRDERLIWLTTVDAKGTPQPTPVWFWWDEATSTFLVYSRADAKRLAHISQNPRVAFNLDGNGRGGDIIVITGEARLSPNDPRADQLPCAGYLGHPFRKRDKILGEDQHCVKKSEQAAFNFILSKSVH
jgi:PPOX class probable F420-dependent enzyme